MNLAFVSENELAQKKKIRQELWENSRKPDDPLECPEEEYDNRTLFERLKEQKDRKQEEFDESRKLKHCIKLLDNDEVEFLEKVDEHKLKDMMSKLDEEKKAIEEFKKHVANLEQSEQDRKLKEFKKSLFGKQTSTNETPNSSNQSARTTRRQTKLLANAIKRKASDKDEDANEQSKRKKDDNEEKGDRSNDDKEKEGREEIKKCVIVEKEQPSAFKSLGVLPGLSSYCSDSSCSDRDDSDDDEDLGINANEVKPLSIGRTQIRLKEIKRTLKKQK